KLGRKHPQPKQLMDLIRQRSIGVMEGKGEFCSPQPSPGALTPEAACIENAASQVTTRKFTEPYRNSALGFSCPCFSGFWSELQPRWIRRFCPVLTVLGRVRPRLRCTK